MPTVQRTPLACAPAVLGLAGSVCFAAGSSRTGWAVAVAAAVGTTVLLHRAVRCPVPGRRGTSAYGVVLGPADLVTLVRAALVCGVAGVVAGSFLHPVRVAVLGWVCAVALVLDGVDGQVARRTGTVTERGARFDMEVDAFLILVLSVLVARGVGAWVLVIGLARYALLAAEQVAPWLRRPVPARRWPRWGKGVAAVQGVVLTVVAAGVLPPTAATASLAVAALLLAESFGHQVRWLWRTRRVAPARTAGGGREAPRPVDTGVHPAAEGAT